MNVFERMTVGFQKAVERVRQRTVDGESDGLVRIQDHIQARMFSAVEAASQRSRYKAMCGDRH